MEIHPHPVSASLQDGGYENYGVHLMAGCSSRNVASSQFSERWFRVGFYRVLSKPDLPKSTRDTLGTVNSSAAATPILGAITIKRRRSNR
jgi:hypothetical protein